MEDNIFDKVHEVDLEKTMKDSYIDYAMSVIASRALPDVREEYSLLRFVSSVTGRMKSMLLSLRSTGALMPRLMWRVRRSQ